jgi:hypothetical protein
MGASLGGNRRVINHGPVDFYTIPHNINAVKVFIAKWYKKLDRRHHDHHHRKTLCQP